MIQIFSWAMPFLTGLVIGSFLNAIIYRLEKGESAFNGRSYCPQCKHCLAWHDLIPVLSFVFLAGKCRYCKKPISWQYPAVEISTAAIFLLIFSAQGGPVMGWQFSNLIYLFTIASLLIIIFVYDLKHYLIPDIVVYSAIGIVFFYKIVEVLSFGHWSLFRNWSLEIRNFVSLENALFSAFLACAFFFAIYAISKGRWMGFGDVEIAFFMGLFLGFPNILVALFFAFFAGAVVGVALILLKKKGMRSEVPFGPFLVAGTFTVLFFGETVWNWYLKLLLV